MPPRWNLLKSRLEAVCPNGADQIRSLWKWRSLPKEQMPFLLQVASYDRQGMLHSLTHALWESDTTVGAQADGQECSSWGVRRCGCGCHLLE